MKKRAVCMLLGVLLAGTVFTGCGKNKATENAKESAQTEKEGTGEETSEESASDSKKNDKKDSKSSEDKKSDEDADKKADNESDKEEQDSADTADTDEADAVEDKEKIAVLFPNEEDWERDVKELEVHLQEDGYEPVILYADDDSSKQVAQIQEMTEDTVSAMVIAPVDPYGLSDVLADVKEAEIPVFSYDDLIMNTNAVKYYVTFGGRQVGQKVAEEIIDREDLEDVQKAGESRTIEFLMGSLDDIQALFFYNGVMDTLQPYFDDGTLVCKSEKTSFDDTGILRWEGDLAKTRMTDILSEAYSAEKTPDIICTGFDEAALGAVEALEDVGYTAEAENWPLISGVDCEADGVKRIAEGKIGFSVFMDRRELADQCESMVNVYLHGDDDPEVNDYEQYDNGVKIIGSYLCEPQLIDNDNYELLIDNGYYTEDEVRPEETEDKEEADTNEDKKVTPTPKPKVTLKKSSKINK